MAAKKKRPAKKKAAPRRPRKPAADPGPFAGIGNPKQRAFLTAFAETASVTRAALAAQCSWQIHYHWKKDPAYADAFKLAEEIAGDVLEAEAIRRAHEGLEEPVVYQGAVIGYWKLPDGTHRPGTSQDEPPDPAAEFQPLTVNKRSDSLLRFLLEGAKGSKYAVHRHQVSGAGGGPVPLAGYGVLMVPTSPESLAEWQAQHGKPTDTEEVS